MSEQIDHMQAAKNSFHMLSPDDRLIFIGWARKEADKDLYGIASEERKAFVTEVTDGLKTGAAKAKELGKDAVKLVKEGGNTLDEKLRKFLGKDASGE